MARYPRVQFVVTCRTCEETITFSIYFSWSTIWNDRDGGKMGRWQAHVAAGHDVSVTHTFFPGWGWNPDQGK